jgi:hypothetical protein
MQLRTIAEDLRELESTQALMNFKTDFSAFTTTQNPHRKGLHQARELTIQVFSRFFMCVEPEEPRGLRWGDREKHYC